MNYEVIHALPTETTGGPDQKLQLPSKVCDGCEKGKSKRLPFPPSTSRAKHVLDLVHSDLGEMSSVSIDGYTYTATYLNDHSQYGMMFLLKNKSKQFRAFKAYKAWAERWYAKGATKIAKRTRALDQSVALWGSESAIQG